MDKMNKKELSFGVCEDCGDYAELIPTDGSQLCESCVRTRDGAKKKSFSFF